MKLVYIRDSKDSLPNNGGNLLQIATCSEPFVNITLSSLSDGVCCRSDNTVLSIPQDWAAETVKVKGIVCYKENLPVRSVFGGREKANQWFIVSNGKFAAQTEYRRLYETLAQLHADVVAINVVPQLQTAHEKVLVTSQNKLIGFRRIYNDMVQLTPVPRDWPHYLFIKSNILDRLLVDGTLPLAFLEFIRRCDSHSLVLGSLNIGGTVFDLETEEGLLGFFVTRFNSRMQGRTSNRNEWWRKKILRRNGCTISPDARLFGEISFGQNISIGQNAIIVGPTVFGNNVKIAEGAVIRTSIIGPDVSIPENHLIQNEVLIEPIYHHKYNVQSKACCTTAIRNNRAVRRNSSLSGFRTWPVFSYAGGVKRVIDFIMAIIVLILFAPVMPIIALAIKLNSPGHVFFKDKRQGLHGREFGCLKFRTMAVGSDVIQDKLRVANQIDGPQFKITDDPRVTSVGRFLRCTYIDEIPQFYNVLLGQMSVVGPRPSPQSENTLCPYWRDARLSVRPGITGLWQVCGTRQPTKDFQEWIYYDTKYVRDLSLKMDLRICWQTAKKLIKNFARQF